MFLKESKLKQVFTNLINFPSNSFKLGTLDYVYVKELILEKVATLNKWQGILIECPLD